MYSSCLHTHTYPHKCTVFMCTTTNNPHTPTYTTQAGALDDVGELGDAAGRHDVGWSSQALTAFLVVVAEGGKHTSAGPITPPITPQGDGSIGGSSTGVSSTAALGGGGGGGGGGQGGQEIGVCAVETSTGDVYYAQFRCVLWGGGLCGW